MTFENKLDIECIRYVASNMDDAMSEVITLEQARENVCRTIPDALGQLAAINTVMEAALEFIQTPTVETDHHAVPNS